MRPGRYSLKRFFELARRDGLSRLLHRIMVTALRKRLRRAKDWLGDAARALLMLGLLRPAADLLPAGWAHGLVDLSGLLSTLVPGFGLAKLHLVKGSLAGKNRESFQITRRMLAQPLHDFVFLRQVLRGRAKVEDFHVFEVNQEIVSALRRERSSFILATGHFARTAMTALSLPRIVPQQITSVVHPLLERSSNPGVLWLRCHYGQMLAFHSFARPDIDLVNPGQPGLIRHLVTSLRESGQVVMIAVDVPWAVRNERTLTRPFAAAPSRSFATGAATLSRIAQKPIALCIPYLETSQQIVVEWVKLVPPPDPGDFLADKRITNDLLDEVELAIGKRPSQYVIDFLGNRKWNCAAQRWG